MANVAGCFCARWCTKGLIAVLHVALDVFWIFSALCGSLFITACIRQSLLCQAYLSLHSALPVDVGERAIRKLTHCEVGFMYCMGFRSVPVLARRAACSSLSSVGDMRLPGNVLFSLEKERAFPWIALRKADSDGRRFLAGLQPGRGRVSVLPCWWSRWPHAEGLAAVWSVGLQLRPCVNTVISCALRGANPWRY